MGRIVHILKGAEPGGRGAAEAATLGYCRTCARTISYSYRRSYLGDRRDYRCLGDLWHRNPLRMSSSQCGMTEAYTNTMVGLLTLVLDLGVADRE
jgi:hypothetical protein